MPQHPLSRTTHTLDMEQIAELDDRLVAPNARTVTAEELGIADARLAPSAALTKVWWEGAPEFPYIFGDFAASSGSGAAVHVALHTPHLLKLSQLLGLHHRWGV